MCPRLPLPGTRNQYHSVQTQASTLEDTNKSNSLNFKPDTPNHKPQTTNPKPQTPNPKPQTTSSKTQPQTLNCTHAHARATITGRSAKQLYCAHVTRPSLRPNASKRLQLESNALQRRACTSESPPPCRQQHRGPPHNACRHCAIPS